MAYATASELRASINMTDAGKDASVLTPALAAAERTINRFCNRPDGFEAVTTATTRIYPGSGKPYQFIDENISISLVEVKESPTDSTYTAWASTDWTAAKGDPNYPNYNETPYDLIIVDPTGDESIFFSGKWHGLRGFRPTTSSIHAGVPTVRVTAKWGFAENVPDDIKEACIMQAARWYKRLEGAMGDALASGELGTLLYRQSLDPDIRMILERGRYIKPVTGRR